MNLFFEEEYLNRYFKKEKEDYVPLKIQQPKQKFSDVLSTVDNRNYDSDSNLISHKRHRGYKIKTEYI